MSSLSEFQELINDIKDEKMLDIAEGLLRDMVEIQNMKERIEKLEDSLSVGERGVFWWFAMNLDREQVDLATNAVIGKKRFLHDQAERERIKQPDYVPEPTMSEIRKQQKAEQQAKLEQLNLQRAQITPVMVANAKASLPPEVAASVSDNEIVDMIIEDEGGLGQFGPEIK